MSRVTLALLGLAVCCTASSPTTVSVFYNQSSLQYTSRPGLLSGASAVATFDAAGANSTGWGKLDVRASSPDLSAYYAAGMAEGLLTCEFVAITASNNDDTDTSNAALVAYTESTEAWTRAQAKQNPASDYWTVVAQLLAQFDGMVEGYNRSACSAAAPLSSTQMWLMQMDGDLEDLSQKFASRAPLQRPPHCSSLVKLDSTDLYFGHATWDTFSNMAPRIFKTYTLPVTRDGQTLNHTMHFSSTGPWLSSVDDFYTVTGSAELGVMETSNTVLNTSLYDLVVPESLLCWVRVVLANRLAVNGSDWADLFGRHHSGTYTNQWQVIDLQQYDPLTGEHGAGLLTVLEEVPGLVHYEDMTEYLRQHSFWPSFNVPYFEPIRARNGDPAHSWSTAPRLKLFGMLAPKVSSVASMQKAIRWNQYEQYPDITGDDPCNAIACRADLRSTGTHPLSAFGAIDAKMSSYQTLLGGGLKANSLAVYAQAGPTHDDQAMFCWANHSFTEHHFHHPNCFDFDWQTLKPTTWAL